MLQLLSSRGNDPGTGSYIARTYSDGANTVVAPLLGYPVRLCLGMKRLTSIHARVKDKPQIRRFRFKVDRPAIGNEALGRHIPESFCHERNFLRIEYRGERRRKFACVNDHAVRVWQSSANRSGHENIPKVTVPPCTAPVTSRGENARVNDLSMSA